jgi:hypothetical protein
MVLGLEHGRRKKFLEDMAAKGYILSKVGIGSYYFNETEKSNLIYQADFKGINMKITEEEYLQMYEDSGWKLATAFGGWYYFYHESDGNPDVSIFNDNESAAGVYKRLLIFLAITGFPLYYQNLIFFPALGALDVYTFHGFLRLFMFIIMIPHLLASIKIIGMYLKFKNEIKE